MQPNRVNTQTLSMQLQITVGKFKSKRVYFSPVEQMNNSMEHKSQSFVFNNCQATFNIAGSSAVACSDKDHAMRYLLSQTGPLPSKTVKIGSLKTLFMKNLCSFHGNINRL